MPRLIRLYIQSVAIGSPFLAAFVAALVWQDVMGIGHLILGSPSGWIAAAMLVVFNGIIFAAVQFGLRVMMLAEDDDTPRGGLPSTTSRARPGQRTRHAAPPPPL